MPAPVKSEVIGFGVYEFNVVTRELRKNGMRLRLEGQPLIILEMLLERPGELVTREEMQDKLWPGDTFVDFEHSLNAGVKRLRAILSDSPEHPRYIETQARRGYRFIGTLEHPRQSQLPAEPIRPQKPRQPWGRTAAGLLAILVLGFVAVTVYRSPRQQPPHEQTTLTAVPFTALPGEETSAAFSPDGSRIAFAWNGDPGNGGTGFDLYVKAIGSETLLRLTHHPSVWITAAWSPDGTEIAFQRMSGADSGLYVVPALGGPEKKLRSTRKPWEDDFPTISWSPDGSSIAFSDWLPSDTHTAIYLLSPATGDAKRIPNTSGCLGQVQPAFSHGGDRLAYWCLTGKEAVLYSLPLQGGKPRMVTLFQDWPTGLTWSGDDKELIFSLWHGFSGQFVEVTVADGSVKTLGFGVRAQLPAVSPRGDKLAFNSYSRNTSIWRRDLAHPESPPVEIAPSSRSQWDAQYSPDGKRVVFASGRSGVEGVWISDEDGGNLVQISNPAQPSGSPQWSPDGTKIVFDSRSQGRWEIYVADVLEQKPRKLVTNISYFARPHWSRDGKWIYFRSQEPGRMGVYRCPASGGDAVVLSKDIDGYNPQESLDGKTVYFASHEEQSTLKKVALAPQPDTEAKVDGLPRLSNAGVWALTPGGIYFASADAPHSLRYFEFAGKQTREIFTLHRDFASGLSVSPDGRSILYVQWDDVSGDIMLVDHFH
jgi:Tol biopolymer transport system component/DNA-binding winged helix-turn-helix (wHTH) protein